MNVKHILPGLYKQLFVIGIFFILTLITVFPLFDGMTLEQHDIKMHVAGAKECIDFRKANDGAETMWTNSMFGGMPSYFVSTVFPSNWTKKIQIILSLNLPGIARIIFASLICFYICLLCFKVRWEVAVIGAIAFTFTGFNLVSLGAGHNSKILALALMPLMVGGLKLLFRKKYLLGLVLLGLGLSLEIGAGHVQITYYTLFILLAFGISELIYAIIKGEYQHTLKVVGFGLVSILLGLLPSTSRLWTTKEYGEYSTRGKSEIKIPEEDSKQGLNRDYVFGYSQGVKEMKNMIFPNMFIAADGHKWSDSNSYPFYLGIIFWGLSIFAIGLLKPKDWIWMFSMASLGATLAVGKHMPSFNNFLYDNLPLYDKFRAVNMALAVTQFSMVLLGTLALNKLLSKDFEWTKKHKITAYIVLGFFIINIIAGLMTSTESPYDARIISQGGQRALDKLIDARDSGITSSIFRTIIFTVIYCVLFFFYRVSKKDNKNVIFGLITALVIFIDLSVVNNKHFNHDNFKKGKNTTKIRATFADRNIRKQKGRGRVFDISRGNPYSDASASYYHASIGGYHGAKLRRFQDLVDKYMTGDNLNAYLQFLQKGGSSSGKENTMSKLLEHFNTTHFIFDSKKAPLKLKTSERAWFIEELKTVDSPDEEINAWANTGFSPSEEAVIDKTKFDLKQKKYTNSGTIKAIKYKPNRIEYIANTDKEGLAVFSEVYYPVGWNVTIDGKESEMKRVNYLFRALEIPAGKHKIVFEFKPDSYYTGEIISMIGSILLISILLLVLFIELKNVASKIQTSEATE